MTTTYGLTPTGLNIKSQQQIITELQDTLKSTYGNNINFSPSSILGSLVGISSEREALLWQLLEAVYVSQYPGGAEGTSVDNILALNNMRREDAAPTRTNPISVQQSNGISLYGLLLKGSPGTLIKAGNIVQTTAQPPLQFKIDNDVTIQPAVNAVQGVYFSNVPTMGAFILKMPNGFVSDSIAYNSLPQKSQIFFSIVPTSGTYIIQASIGGVITSTSAIPFNATAAQVQTAVQGITGSNVTVTGDYTAGFVIDFSLRTNPLISVITNTTDATITYLDSIQAKINNIFDGAFYPYTDATVVSSSQGYAFTFGNGFLLSGQVTCGNQPLALMVVNANTLQETSNVTNIKIVNSTQGANAQVVASATCTLDGPNFVAAEALAVIGTPISGWTGVVNQLDCITGTNVENDTEALIRRDDNLQANANGPLQSIVEKVKAVPDVTAAIGDENVYLAARQRISFAGTSTSGTYKISINGILTAAIPYNATASQLQTAIRNVSGYTPALVNGDSILGFNLDFNGSLGGKEIPLVSIVQNTTGLTITVAYGLPGKSFAIVVQGGADLTIADAILKSKPGGMLAYGSTVETVFDTLGNSYAIGFSRPTAVPIYVTINLVTDLNTAINPAFNVGTVTDIQEDIVNIGNEVGIGGLVIGLGSNGLIGAFNNVPGIISYSLTFGRSVNPTTFSNIQMQSNEVPTFETFLVAINYV